jgi:NTP pyrophosphatase (non-canonical NTP hydrolase)
MNDRIDEAHQDSIRWFPHKANDPVFILLALAGEVGEAANLLKKYERGSKTWVEIEDDLVEEIIDVQTYLNGLMGAINEQRRWLARGKDAIDWDAAYDKKRDENNKRFSPLRVVETAPATLPELRQPSEGAKAVALDFLAGHLSQKEHGE